MAATTLLSPPPQQPLTERESANMMDHDLITSQEKVSKKRKSDVNGEGSKKKKRESVAGTPGRHCHQCHQVRDVYLECTYLTTRGKKTERCGKMFCQDCLKRRYDEEIPSILSAGRPKDFNKLLGHVQSELYVWRCPICRKICNCAPHRKQYGLPPTGFLTSFAKEKGVTVAQLLKDPDAVEAARAARESKEAASKKGKALSKDKEFMEESSEKIEKEKREKKKPTEKKDKADKQATENGKDRPANNATLKLAKQTSERKREEKSKMVTTIPVSIRPFVKLPKHVEDPEFEFIGISYPLEVIEKRLHVREFLLRFEKLMVKLPPKYVRTINDPNSEWTDLTYRNLITSLLPIVQADANQIVNGDMVYEAVDNIKKVTADSPDVWNILKNLLETVYVAEDLDINCGEEDGKLNVIMLVIHLALQSSVVRTQIEEDGERERERHKVAVAQIKRLKTDWEQTKTELQKERLLIKAGERTEWDERYGNAFNAHKKLVARVEEKEWFSSRKTTARNSPLGNDAKGNIYWLFTQRDKREEDWGQWVVVQKNPALPYPSGTLPQFDESSNPSNDDSSLPDLPEPENEETAKSRIWYAVEGASNVRHLAKWIRYQSELILYKKANEYSSFAATPPDTPKKKKREAVLDTPSRQLMVEVRLPQRTEKKLRPEELITKENTEALYMQLQKIAGFMELNEEVEKLI